MLMKNSRLIAGSNFLTLGGSRANHPYVRRGLTNTHAPYWPAIVEGRCLTRPPE